MTDSKPHSESTLAVDPRLVEVPAGFSLPETCGPVAWGGGRWPNIDWRDEQLVWVGWEYERVVFRTVRHMPDQPGQLLVAGTASTELDRSWLRDVLGVDETLPGPIDPVVDAIRDRFPGMRPWSNGSLYEGLIGAIVGQSISVAAAAVTEARLAALFHDVIDLGGRRFWPLPAVDRLASADVALVRTSGVTWRRAEALVTGARAFLSDEMPTNDEARAGPDAAKVALRTLPLVGPWTAESILLWGLGLPDAYPPKDVALLRAARLAYDRPDLDHPGLNALAETWSPARAWAARWLWTELLGPAPTRSDAEQRG